MRQNSPTSGDVGLRKLDSIRIYGWLIGLYPRAHQDQYGAEMRRLFADQCREASSQGKGALLALWLRTLWDLVRSVAREHLAGTDLLAGLLAAPAGKPLPWTGVTLVLVPGVVVFIAQLGQLNGKDWWFSTLSWAAYVFLIPTAIVWIVTRKFPVWGFLPLGVAFYTYGYLKGVLWRWLYGLSLTFVLPLKHWLQPGKNVFIGDGFLGVPLLALVLFIILALVVARQQRFSRAVWIWLGVFAVIVLATPVVGLVEVIHKYGFFPNYSLTHSIYLNEPSLSHFADTADALFLLLFIFAGSFLARRHGTAATLLVVGYMLPVMVYGLYSPELGPMWGTTLKPDWILAAVFTYRICIALISPIWIVRTISKGWQTAAVIAPTALALLVQLGLQVADSIAMSHTFNYLWTPGYISWMVTSVLELMAGLLLALALYRNAPKVSGAPKVAAETA